jgi:serine phosphatase RsbU (regulator of sigma subunit)
VTSPASGGVDGRAAPRADRSTRDPSDNRTESRRDPSGIDRLPAAALATVVQFEGSLNGCTSTTDVISAAVGPGLGAFGASAAIVGLTDFRLRLDPVVGSAGVEEIASRCTQLPLDADVPLAETIRTGRPIALRPLANDFLGAPFPAEVGAVRECTMPILGGRGVMGGIWLLLGPEERPAEDDLMALLIARLATAIDRARLVESERRMRVRAEWSAARVSRVQSLTSGLSAALGPVDVADVVMNHALAELGASEATCYMLTDEGTLKPVRSIGSGSDPPRTMSLSDDDPMGAILRRSAVVVLPDSVPDNGDGGLRALVPLSLRGEVLGAIELVFPAEQDLDAELRAFLGVLGTQCAQAVERARLYALRSREAHVLQASLMPPALPQIPGLEVAAAYRPFGDGTVVGGDFYDIYALDPGRWGLVVGDVSGKGIEAAAITALARHTTRAAALLGMGPAEVLRTLNRVMLSQSLGERFCTIVQGILEPTPEGVAVTLSLGGHPRPLLLDGRKRRVRPVGTLGTAVGVLPDPVLAETRLTLRKDDVLVFFTDGCINFQAEGRTTSDERVLLRALREHAREDARELTSRLEDQVLNSKGGPSADDVTLLVVRAGTDDP